MFEKIILLIYNDQDSDLLLSNNTNYYIKIKSLGNIL